MIGAVVMVFTLPALLGLGLGNPARGGQQLQARGCTSCHWLGSMWDKGGSNQFFQSRLSPSRLIGVIWGHAPQIWSSPRGQLATMPSREDCEDILAYFFAAGYFESPGDARRGSLRFTKLQCATCHELASVSRWKVVGNPPALLHAMWRHREVMEQALEIRRMAWPSLTTDDMRDLLSFFASRATSKHSVGPPIAGSAERGEQLFHNRECSECHRGALALDPSSSGHGLAELAAALWNHAPMLTRDPAPLSQPEMADLLAYLWKLGYFEEPGNALRGRQVFEARGCGNCHAGSAQRKPVDSARALGAVWSHYPLWKESKMTSWPRFGGGEMGDLLAFWNRGSGAAGPSNSGNLPGLGSRRKF